MSDSIDHQIMTRLREGEIEALGQLFDRHHEGIFQHCYRMTGDAEVAQDLTQELFLRVLRYRESWKGRSKLTTWLHSITRNLCLDYLHRNSNARAAMRDLTDERRQTPATGGDKPEDPVEEEERSRLLDEAMLRLPEDRREIIVLSRFMDMSYAEIGKILDCSINAARVRLHRAINDLRDIYLETERKGP